MGIGEGLLEYVGKINERISGKRKYIPPTDEAPPANTCELRDGEMTSMISTKEFSTKEYMGEDMRTEDEEEDVNEE